MLQSSWVLLEEGAGDPGSCWRGGRHQDGDTKSPCMAPACSRSSSARASPSELKALGQMAEKWVNLAKFALFQRQG